ncbi:MAG: type II secretion system F family protein, partial [Thermodesulfovibrionia bacterium]|nr:type II secretion system F family protein [Thermodesulfovibrionia bacterium]
MKMSFFRKRKLKKEVEKAMLPPKKEDGKISQKSKVSVPEKQEKTRSSQDSAKINTRNVKEKKERKILPKKKFSILLERAGLSISLDKLSEIIFKSAVVINILISIYLIYFFSVNSGYSLAYVIVIMINLWLLGFIVLIISLWLMFYLFLDLKIYQRNISIVEVFPDFLQLTSANIRAGMAIDQALWHAIRPNFGVLAKEMEDVAKKTMTGMSLEEALYDFASKYESPTIKRSISLLIEGLNAGGEIGELLDRISNNIQESKTMQKEMAASVTTYAIFISFASIAAAPFLLALSSQLL